MDGPHQPESHALLVAKGQRAEYVLHLPDETRYSIFLSQTSTEGNSRCAKSTATRLGGCQCTAAAMRCSKIESQILQLLMRVSWRSGPVVECLHLVYTFTWRENGAYSVCPFLIRCRTYFLYHISFAAWVTPKSKGEENWSSLVHFPGQGVQCMDSLVGQAAGAECKRRTSFACRGGEGRWSGSSLQGTP